MKVQEQNAITRCQLREVALHWRERGLPRALRAEGETRGIAWDKALVLKLEVDFPGMPRLWGLLLTEADRFIEFELETDPAHETVERVDVWGDVTDAQNLSVHNRGFGLGWGALAIQVRPELNGEA